MTTAFYGWVRRQVIQDEEFVACGLDPDSVDWKVVSASLLQTVMSHLPQ